MKKLMSFFTLAMVFSVAASAQNNYDLRFKFKLPAEVELGKGFTLVDTVYNNGPDAFPGGEYYFYYTVNSVGNSEKEPDKKKLDSFLVKIPPIDAGGSAVCKVKNVVFHKGEYTSKTDSTNIVIIWPTGEMKDRVKTNNKAYVTLYAKNAKEEPVGQVGIAATGKNDEILFTAYPVPASSDLRIRLSEKLAGNVRITLTDLNGREMQTVNTDSNGQLTVPVSALSEGVYLLRVTSGDQTAMQRLVVQH